MDSQTDTGYEVRQTQDMNLETALGRVGSTGDPLCTPDKWLHTQTDRDLLQVESSYASCASITTLCAMALMDIFYLRGALFLSHCTVIAGVKYLLNVMYMSNVNNVMLRQNYLFSFFQ